MLFKAKKLRTLMNIYWMLCDAVHQANVFYGDQLMAVIFTAFVDITITSYYFFVFFEMVKVFASISGGAWILIHICYFVVLIKSSTDVINSSLFKVCDAVIKHITIGRNAVSTPMKSSNRTVVAVENIFLDLVPAGTKRDILLRSSGESIAPLISLCRKTISNILLLHSSVDRRNSCSSAGTETSR
ncbi:hypothetical protein J6590_074025 [Homalodisca vitripennis]|nr:hypothetical protein J6590_074025 [Homalodisca vitripennis]